MAAIVRGMPLDMMSGEFASRYPFGPYTFEVTITELPDEGAPTVVAGPWRRPVNFSPGGACTIDVPRHDRPSEQLSLRLDDMSAAEPGWLGTRAELRDPAGQIVGASRPVAIYAHPLDTGTYLYFREQIHGAPSYAVQVRAVDSPYGARS